MSSVWTSHKVACREKLQSWLQFIHIRVQSISHPGNEAEEIWCKKNFLFGLCNIFLPDNDWCSELLLKVQIFLYCSKMFYDVFCFYRWRSCLFSSCMSVIVTFISGYQLHHPVTQRSKNNIYVCANAADHYFNQLSMFFLYYQKHLVTNNPVYKNDLHEYCCNAVYPNN